MIKVGILGAGNIAGVMADTLRRMDNVICCAVAARDGSRAEAFAKTYGFAESYGSYEEMLASSEAELIYVATPHSCHYDHVKLCCSMESTCSAKRRLCSMQSRRKKSLPWRRKRDCC